MATVEWRKEALEDLSRVLLFLKKKSEDSSKKAANKIDKGAWLLSENPRLGRPMPDETGRCELFVTLGVGAYILRYKVIGQKVVILRVWHNKENRE